MSDAGVSSSVSVEVSEGVATVRLVRPEAMNSLDVPTKVALLAALREVGADDAVRCVVLTGSGRAFCTGQDLKEHVGLLRDPDGPLFDTVTEHYNPLVTAIVEMEKPVVAAVNGVAAGAGASLAFACDLRVVSAAAGFNLAFAGVGLSCDTGASVHLPMLVGRAKALELLFFPRTIPAEEAFALGLATSVVPADELDAAVAELTARLAAGPTVAYGAMRRAVRYAAGHSVAEALAFEATQMTLTGATADHRGAVEAFVAKQKPVFEGR